MEQIFLILTKWTTDYNDTSKTHTSKLCTCKLDWNVPGKLNTCRLWPYSFLVPACHLDLLPFQMLTGNLVSLQALGPCQWQLKHIYQAEDFVFWPKEIIRLLISLNWLQKMYYELFRAHPPVSLNPPAFSIEFVMHIY